MNEIADRCVARFQAGGWKASRSPHAPTGEEPQLGDLVVGRLEGAGGPRVLMIGHTDTVFDPGTAAARPFRIEGDRAYGPGVSDMKGGTATRNVLITAGNGGGKFTISGRVTLNGQGVQNVLVNANNTNGVVTDRDGRYTIANLGAGSFVMTPLLYGYSFSELFNNNVTVGPNFAGADAARAELEKLR